MANCEDIKDKNSQAYKDCVEKNKPISKTILDPIRVDVINEDKEVANTDYIRLDDDYKLGEGAGIGDKIKNFFGAIDLGKKTTFEISEDETVDGGFFTVGSVEGKDNLENLFEGIDGLNVEYSGSEYDDTVVLSYKNKNGNIVKSDNINFSNALSIADSDDISKNMDILSNFLDKNVDLDNEELLGFLGVRKDKIKTQKIIEQDFLDSKVVSKINKEYDDPKLFMPKTGSVRGIASKFNVTGELPYSEEIKKEISVINQRISAGELPTAGEGDIIKQAQDNVREVLRVEAVTKAKKLFYADRSNKGLDQQSDDFIGSLLLAKSYEDDIEDSNATLKVYVNDQNTTHETLKLGRDILSGKNSNPLNVKLFEEKVKSLGIEKPTAGFAGAVMSGEGADAKWDIMTQKKFVEAGSPDELEEITLTNGVKTTRTVLNLQKQLFDNYNARKIAYDNEAEKRTDLVMNLKEADIINDIASKSYDDLKANITTAGLTGADLLAGAGYLTSKLLNSSLKYNRFGNANDTYVDNDIDRELDKLMFGFKDTTIALQNRLRDRVEFDDAFTNPMSFGKFLLEESFVQLPILLSMAVGGSPAAYIMGASGKFSDMKFSNYMGDSDYDMADMIWMPAAYGMAEGVFAQVSTVPILKRFKQRFKGSTGGSDLLQQGSKEWVKDNWKRAIVYDPLLEWGAESLTQGSQNLIDGKPFLENMDHAGFSGFSISLMMGSSSMAVGTYQSSFSSFDQRQKIRTKQQELNSLGTEYNKLDKRTKEAKIIENQIVDARRELKIEIENSAEMSNNNIREGFASRFVGLVNMQSQLQADARTIVDSKELSDGYKKVTLAKMESEYNAIEQLKATSLQGNNLMKYRPEFALLEKTDAEEYNNIIQEATTELEGNLDGKKPTPEQIKRQGYEVYLKRKVIEMNAQAGKNGELLTEYPTIADALVGLDTDNLTDKEKAEARVNIMGGANGWTSKNGRTNVIVDNQVANQKKNTAVHEIGHKVFWQILKNNEQAFKPIADQLLSDIQESNPDIYEEFVNSIERGADGRLLSQEVIMNFLELAADGKVGNNNTIKGMFGSIVQKVFNKKYNFDFKGEKDINTFVTELGKKIKDGTLSTEDIKAASANTTITQLTPYKLFSSENKSNTAFSKGDGFANANIASELNLTNSTQSIVGKNNKVFNDIVELSKLPENKDIPLKDLVTQKMKDDLVTNNMPRVTALAKQAAQAGQNINLEESLRKTFDDFNGEYALKLTELANSWNPSKNDSFGAYMNQLLPLKYSGILAKLKKGESDQTTRIDESTTQIADVSTGSSVDTVVEPKIDPLTFLPDGKNKDKFVKSLNNALQDATPEQLKNISFANPLKSDKLLNEFADMFNLLTTGRDGKVKNPLIDKSFNFSDVNNLKDIQRQIIKNYQNLRNSMPKGNETVFTRKGRQGLVKEGGGSLALTTKFLNEYYTKLPKKISNNVQYKPKQLTKTEWLAPLGIVGGKVDPNYTPRAGQAQTLKGMFDAIYKNVASQAASAQLEIDQQLDTDAKARAKANVRSGKSDLVFSAAPNTTLGQAERLITNKNTRFNYTSNIGEFIDTVVATNKVAEAFEKVYGQYNIPTKAKEALIQTWQNINIQARLKEVEMDLGNPLKINQQKYLYESFAESQSQVIRDVLGISKDGLNYSDINQMEGMNNTLMEVVNSYRENGKSEAEIYETMYTMASTFTGSSKIGNGTLNWKKQKNGDWKLVKNKKAKGDQRYDLYTNANEMMNVLGLKKPKGFNPEKKVGQSKDAYIRNLRKNDSNLDDKILNKSADYAKKNKDAFFDLLDWYKSLPAKQKAMHKNGMGMILASSYRGTNTLIRESAPVNSIAETDFSEDFGQYRYEHNPPASVMAIYSAEYLTDNKTKKQLQAEFDNFGVTIIPLSMDAVLDENYQSTIPLGNLGRFGRYYNLKNFGKFPFVTKLYYKKDGKWDTRTYGDLAPAAFAIKEAEINAKKVEKDGEIHFSKPQNQPIYPNPETLSNEFNTIIEQTLGVEAGKRFSDIVAKRRGAKKGLFRPFVPPSMEDFQGLMYDLYTKGTLGEQQMKWVKDNLIDPYQKGVANIDVYRQTLKQDYKALLKKFPNVKKNLGKTVPGTDFTQDQAIRVSLWTKAGYEIPGISKRDAKKLNDFVDKNPELGLFGEGAVLISKQNNWSKPDPYWDVQSILSDLDNFTNNVGRKQFLEQFNANVEGIFSKENMNKLEASLGTNWRNAMEDSLYRMQTGTNRPSGADKLVNSFMNWTNNSIGAIMFFNRKSALLQTISSVNFLNWSDNNPVKAAMAFANFPQFIKDFSFLWNSPKLKQRRSGLRSDVNEAEIANAVRGATNKAQAMLSYLLKLGFTPTQLADSFAIASGGATFYRNRLNSYKKQGMSETDAANKAFEDFSETSEVSQQSADPMFISQQQAGVLGRLILAFQNTPAQVTRLFKKASRDFINVRGDQKTNLSKMVYYGAIQGFIFASLQNAIFVGADEEDDDEKAQAKKELKQSRIIHSMTDTLLRGSGVYGAIIATLKNTINKYYVQKGKSAFAKDNAAVLLELANLSPPIGSKLRKINNALKTEDYNQDIMDKMGYDVTYKGKVILSPKYNIIASTTEGLTNIPLERAMNEFLALSEMMDQRNSTLQRISLALGYRAWDVGAKIEEFDEIKIEAKENRAKASKERARLKREEVARLKEAKKYEGKTPEQIVYIKRYEVVMKQKKPEQVKTLSELGLTTKQIKALKYEKDRAKKILELQDKNK